MLHDFLTEAIDNQTDGLFFADAALAAVKKLLVADFRGGGLMFDNRRFIAVFNIRHGVRTAVGTD